MNERAPQMPGSACCPASATDQPPRDEAAALRRRAEDELACRATPLPDGAVDMLKLVHELRVHQIELEMQNETLRAAQAAVEADLARFVDLCERGPVGYFTVTQDGTITRLNLAAAGLLGLAGATPGGRRLGAYVAGASLAALNDFLACMFSTGARAVCELDLCRGGDGPALTVHVEGMRDRSGQICHLAAINISARRRVEQALHESRDDLDRAQAVAHIGSWRLDAARDTFVCSDELARIYGFAPGAPPSHAALADAVHPDDRERVADQWARALRGEAPFDIDHRIVVDGAVRWVRARATLDVAADGALRGGFGITQDITERKRTEQSLHAAKADAERADNAKSRFLAAASHDLRQPLAALALYVDVLQHRVAARDAQPVRNMKDCVSCLSELLNDLLDLSKLSAGVVTPEPRDFAIDTVLAKVVSAHLPQARLKGLALRYAACDAVVRTDPVLLGRIVGNLVANAVCYTERGGVLVACRRRHGRLWVEVWDTGIGIPPDKTGEVFEEFKQLGNDQRGHGKGSGLGLAIVARATALLGLKLRMRSRLGRGSMFAVELPPGHAVAAVAEPAAPGRALRIALVEDNPAVLEALAYSLQALGHEVIAAVRGAALFTHLDGHAPDLVISDYRLADRETGLDVIRAARGAFGAELPAIIITGDTDPKLMRTIGAAGIELQHKPLALDALQRCIASLSAPH